MSEHKKQEQNSTQDRVGSYNPDVPSTHNFKEWLDKIQQESWQLELIISSLALFLVIGLKPQIQQLDAFIALRAEEASTYLFDGLSTLAWTAWYVFIINLIIHITVRGLWIGAIGLRYVSGDIDFRRLNYSTRFENYLTRNVGQFDSYIEKLERAGSILFSFTYLLFFLFLSLILIFLPPVLVIDYFTSNSKLLIFLLLIYLLFGSFYMFDFLSLGGIKKIDNRIISSIYFYIYLFFSAISLSFLYRPLLYNFLDNPYSRRLLWLFIPYSLIIIGLPSEIKFNDLAYFPVRYPENADEFENTLHHELVVNWVYYEDLRKAYLLNQKNIPPEVGVIRRATLDRYMLEGEQAWLFLRISEDDERYLKKIAQSPKVWKTGFLGPLTIGQEYDSLRIKYMAPYYGALSALSEEKKKNPDKYDKTRWEAMKDSLEEHRDMARRDYQRAKGRKILQAFQGIYEVSIDSVDYTDSLICHFYLHPNMGEKGLLCRVPLRDLPHGDHLLELKRKEIEEDTVVTRKAAVIPFFTQ